MSTVNQRLGTPLVCRRTLGAIILLVLGCTFAAMAREITPLTGQWLFQKGDETSLASGIATGAGWEKISLPHCWGWQEAQTNNTYYRGPGWYQRELVLRSVLHRRYFLRFEAASTLADVFFNGHQLGEHRGGFGAFCYEITGLLNVSGTNTIAVRVSNAREPDIAPLAGDFCVFGGLYRPAYLLVTDETCFTPLDHASPGVFWAQTSVSKKAAVIDLTAEISNGDETNVARVLVAKILDADGQVVASQSQPIDIPGHVTPAYQLELKLNHPHLWNGRLDPYLYHAVAELQTTNGEVCDSQEHSLGLRFYRVDPDKGFFLNGKPYRIRGVCRHQDVWNEGWALSEADHRRDVQLICDIGANAVRCSHYQQSDYFYSLCDQAGLLVWAEIPLVNDITPGPAFAETSRNQLLDLVRQNRNHPAIFAWSLYNEIQPTTSDPHRLLQDLNELAHAEDPTRPTIAASDHLKWPEMPKIPDLIGWNKYPGWYVRLPDYMGPLLDSLRYTSRAGGICVSEYGAGANPFQHELPPRQPISYGQWHPEEWQCVVHEQNWAAIKARPFVWGSFAWNMFDFVVASRNEGARPHINDKGLVTSDRLLKKDAFFFYQANWSDLPVLYITSRRFTERTKATTSVKIYSNAKKVVLTVNGQPQAPAGRSTNGIFIWQTVRLAPGTNIIKAAANWRGRALQDECVWNLASPHSPE